jgi:hypothetical protein
MRLLMMVAWMAGVPGTVFAQAAIAGTVTDASGAVVAGVLVEARSGALIENVRAAVTDGAGRYRIDNLPFGIYSVQFTLDEWSPLRRERIELAGAFTATVDAQLGIAPVSETVIATAEIPALDVHDAARVMTLDGATVRSIPSAGSYSALVTLIPGVTTPSNDVVTGTATTAFPIHGGRPNESRLQLDGFNVGSPPAGNSAASYVIDVGGAAGVSFVTSGGLGEVETAGLVMNVIPQSGGNTRRGTFFVGGSGTRLQSQNQVYDVRSTFGGPIRADRAWMFLTGHTGASRRDVLNVFYNLNAGDPATWLYAPDLSRREYSDRTFENASGRVTWQLTPKYKAAIFWDAQAICRTCTGATPGNSEPNPVSPEAVGVLGRPLHVTQATWSAVLTDRLLVDGGFGGTFFGVGNFERRPNPTRGLIRVAEQCASGCDANGNIPGLVYRSQDFSRAYAGSYLWKGALSHVTGTQSVKVGYQQTLMIDDRTWMTNDQSLTYRFDNGVPNQLTQSISPWVNDARTAWIGMYAQGQRTSRGLTLQAAVRFDRAWSWFPAQQEGPSRFLTAPIRVPATRGVDSYTDLTSRLGAVYDVLGRGTTVLKATLGKYLEGAGVYGMYANTNPTLRMPQTTMAFGTAGVTRTWIDANGNFAPDCDLLDPAAQDRRAAGGDLCGVLSNTSFGQNVLSNTFDTGVLGGWGVRPSDWNLALSFQRQIGRRSSVDVTYSRRWYRGFSVVDNLAVQPSNLTPFSIVAPRDPRLPGGGGYVISGLYDVTPDTFGQVANLVADSGRYGAWIQYFNGLDLTVSVRAAAGLTIIGGSSTGQSVADNCDVRAHLPELSTTTIGTSAFGPGLGASSVTPLSPYCHVPFGILTQLRGLASYVVPRADIQLAATFQSKPGPMLAANYAVPNADVAPVLGRSLSGNAPSVLVNLVAPGTMYGDRINELDIRIAKILRVRRTRSTIALDIYNALNSGVALAYSTTYGPGSAWLQPTARMTPRFLMISAETEF